MMTGGGPVGHVEHHIIVSPVPAKYRETQIVTNLGQNPKGSQLKDLPLLSLTEVLFLPARTEEVSLVIIIFDPFRGDPEKAIINQAIMLPVNKTARYITLLLLCKSLHPLDRFTVLPFGQLL